MRRHRGVVALEVEASSLRRAIAETAHPNPGGATNVALAHAVLLTAIKQRPAEGTVTLPLQDVAAELRGLRRSTRILPALDLYAFAQAWCST